MDAYRCPDPDAEDPRACDDCGSSAAITEPTGEVRNDVLVWRCRRCSDLLAADDLAVEWIA